MTYQKKNLFEETFKQFPDGIIFTDKNRKLQDINEAFLFFIQDDNISISKFFIR